MRFFRDLMFAIIAQMLCGNHLKLTISQDAYQNSFRERSITLGNYLFELHKR